MRKILFILTITVIFNLGASAQDLIIKKNGDEIQAKITEITATELKYKKYNYLEGPTFSINKSDVFMVRYENGEKDIFSDQETKTATNKASFNRGKGFFIRPELDREISLKIGYQISPFVQIYSGAGFDPWLVGIGGSLGARAYTNEGNWSAFFDLRLGGLSTGVVSSSLVVGAAFKDFDFGAGLTYYTNGYSSRFALTILDIGYNIRCYKHR